MKMAPATLAAALAVVAVVGCGGSAGDKPLYTKPDKNLFPEAALPRPGFHEKDKLENRLQAEGCSRKLTLHSA
jgi:hypothetical protein